MTAIAPWAGLAHLYDLAMITALTGGILGLFVLLVRRGVLRTSFGSEQWRARLARHMPYGVAIAGAGGFVMLNGLLTKP